MLLVHRVPVWLSQGKRATASDDVLVGTVLSLGQPGRPGAPWYVEIVVTPPGYRNRRMGYRRPVFLGVVGVLVAMLCISGLVYGAVRRLPPSPQKDSQNGESGDDTMLQDAVAPDGGHWGGCTPDQYASVTAACSGVIANYHPYVHVLPQRTHR